MKLLPFGTSRHTASESRAAVPAFHMDKVHREFLPAALELLETPPSPVRIAAIWAIGLFLATALAWCYFGWLEIFAVAGAASSRADGPKWSSRSIRAALCGSPSNRRRLRPGTSLSNSTLEKRLPIAKSRGAI